MTWYQRSCWPWNQSADQRLRNHKSLSRPVSWRGCCLASHPWNPIRTTFDNSWCDIQPVYDLMFFSQVAQSPQHCVRDLPQVFLPDFPGFLNDQVETATIHVLHANVDFSVTGGENEPTIFILMQVTCGKPHRSQQWKGSYTHPVSSAPWLSVSLLPASPDARND